MKDYHHPRGVNHEYLQPINKGLIVLRKHTTIIHENRAIKTTQEREHDGLKNEVTITNKEEFTMSTATTYIHEPNCIENEHTSITHDDWTIKTTQEGEHDGLKNEVTITSPE